MPYGMGCILSPLRSKNYRINRACEGKMPSRQPAGRRRYRCAPTGYFWATSSRARLSSGRVEFDPSQTFSSSA